MFSPPLQSTCELWCTGKGSYQGVRFMLRKPFCTRGCLWSAQAPMPCYQLTFLNARSDLFFQRWCQNITYITINDVVYPHYDYLDGALTGFALKDDYETLLLAPLAFKDDDNQIMIHAHGYDTMKLHLTSSLAANTALTALPPPQIANIRFNRQGSFCYLSFAETRAKITAWLKQITEIRANDDCYRKSSRTMPLKSRWYDFDHWGNLILSLDKSIPLTTLTINAHGYRPLCDVIGG